MARANIGASYRGLVEERDAAKLELHTIQRSLGTFETGGTRLLRANVRVAAAQLALVEGSAAFIRNDPGIEELRSAAEEHTRVAREAFAAVEASIPPEPTADMPIDAHIAAAEARSEAIRNAEPIREDIVARLGRAYAAIRARAAAASADNHQAGLPRFGCASLGLDARSPAPPDAHPIPYSAAECEKRLARIAASRKPLPSNGETGEQRRYSEALAALDEALERLAQERAQAAAEEAGGVMPYKREQYRRIG